MGDFSDNYTSNKLAYIAIGFGNKVLKFKPFLDSLSFKMDRSDPEVSGDIYTNTPVVGNFKSSRYNLGFSVLATNLEEARENHRRFQVLARMVCPNEINITRNRYLFVQFANLISSSGASGAKSPGMEKLMKDGFECVIKKVSYKPMMDLGFFESKGYVFAKGYSLSLELINKPMDNLINQPIKQTGYSYGRTGGVIVVDAFSMETEAEAREKKRQEAVSLVVNPGYTETVTDVSMVGTDHGESFDDLPESIQETVTPQTPPAAEEEVTTDSGKHAPDDG